MPELASQRAGGKVFFSTSLDPEHPGEHVLDGRAGTYWISTGLFPQELIVELGSPGVLQSVRIACTRARRLRLEHTHEENAVNFALIGEAEIQDSDGLQSWSAQLQAQDPDKPTCFVRLTLLSGWDDFCSVHDIAVSGQPVQRSSAPPPEPAADDGAQSSTRRPNNRKKTMLYPDDSSESRPTVGRDRDLKRSCTGPLEVQIPEHAPKGEFEPDAPRMKDNVSTWNDADTDMVEGEETGAAGGGGDDGN